MYRHKKVSITVVTILAISLICIKVSWAASINLPKDANGWTLFTPSADSRLVYISAQGNDSTGEVYAPSDTAIGSDPFNPQGTIKPFATYAAAFAHTRDHYPDYILFKRGDVFTDTIGTSIHSGRSATEPFVIGTYGNSGASPVINSGSTAVKIMDVKRNWITFFGLDFYAYKRDPDNPAYDVNVSEYDGFFTAFYHTTDGLDGALVEGCKFRFFATGISLIRQNSTDFKDITFRRCVISHSYNSSAHSTGAWSSKGEGLTFEENIFYHNGWLIKNRTGNQYDPSDGQAVWFNHNVYMGGLTKSSFKNNVFAEGACSGLKLTAHGVNSTHDIIITGNLFVGNGEVGFNIGNNYNEYQNRFQNINIHDNVFTDIGVNRLTHRNVSWYAWINGWKDSSFNNNLLIHQTHSDSNSVTILLGERLANTTISNNIIYGIKNAKAISTTTNENITNLSIDHNTIQLTDHYQYFVSTQYTTGVTFSTNKYYSDDNSQQFNYLGAEKNFGGWVAGTGDTSAISQKTFPDPTRNIETYMSSIGETPSLDNFFHKLDSQGRYNWNMKFTAPVVNDWLKAGFGITSPGNGGNEGSTLSAPTGFSISLN